MITTEVIHNHLNTILDERVQFERKIQGNEVYDDVVDAARILIPEIKVKEGAEAYVRLETLWRAFLKVFYEKNQDFYTGLKEEELGRIRNELAQTSDVGEILRLADMRAVVTDITEYAASIDMLLMSFANLRYIVDGYVNEAYPNEVKFLQEVINLFESGDFNPHCHFVIMQEIDERRMVVGGQVDKGKLISLGYDSLTHVCRTGAFDRAIVQQECVIMGNLTILYIDDNYEDYPAAVMNPYALPEGLFLVKCGTDWAKVDLMGSRFSRVLEA